MENFKLDEFNRFIITEYQQKRPFTNMMPGIAGPMGIPMWVFYVNRGQAITSFGIANKDHPIMEFQPANKAYQVTNLMGFRTFIKRQEQGRQSFFEPFASGTETSRQKMLIDLNELAIQDESQEANLRVEVLYFNLSQEPVAGLIRQVKITNLSDRPADLEILDGMPVVISYGLSNQALKETSRTLEAWIDVKNQDQNLPFFQLRSSLGDTAEVQAIQAGNFAFAMAIQNGRPLPVKTIVNPETVFGQDTSLQSAMEFRKKSLSILTGQTTYSGGKTPCAIFGLPVLLPPGDSVTLYSIYGFANNFALLNQVSPLFSNVAYFDQKRQDAQQLIDDLTRPITTKTSSQVFDAYCRQTFLDNILRGGWPVQFGKDENPVTYHIYSRKHGDPERDYNAFNLAPEFYSQGNGNYRDVNQNRRNDVWFEPRVNDTNIRSFMGLIQTDGYNPLIVKGSKFRIPQDKLKQILNLAAQPKLLVPFLKKPFTPGGLLTWLEEQKIELHLTAFEFLEQSLQVAEQFFDAEFGEGYWTDHWTYNLDLIDSFLAIFPDQVEKLLFTEDSLPFFESPIFVQPRSRKYVLAGDQPRQYHAIYHDPEKAAMIESRRENQNLMRSHHGLGPVFRTSLFNKLSLLAVIKFATLDPYGMGIEMEADRPSWCDALNGLPGLFGSSFSETLDLSRLLNFLIENMPQQDAIELPVEVIDLYQQIDTSLQEYAINETSKRDFIYWDTVATAREGYREKTRFGFDGACEPVLCRQLAAYFTSFLKKVQDGIDRAVQQNEGIPPTYFTYTVERFEVIHDQDGKSMIDEKNHAYIKVSGFRQNVLPLFLEAPVRQFKIFKDLAAARQLYNQIKNSELYDKTLNMYKTNASLIRQPLEIGRLRVFTPGWLENESVFLHMEYKYLLATLRAGLYSEFFTDFQHALTAFQDPSRYGRSPLENSSFIVSSAHPDPELHGRGFVARLTGSTAEFLSMWNQMMIGGTPFSCQDGNLSLQLRPSLPGWLFDVEGKLSFNFLGHCLVTYINPSRENTYDEKIRLEKIQLFMDDDIVEIEGPVIPSPYAAWLREGRIQRINAFLIRL
jgi:hypothetical protein